MAVVSRCERKRVSHDVLHRLIYCVPNIRKNKIEHEMNRTMEAILLNYRNIMLAWFTKEKYEF